MTSSPTWTSAVSTVRLIGTGAAMGGNGVAGACGISVSVDGFALTSPLKLVKVSTSIVDRSWRGGTLADKPTDNGSIFGISCPVNWKNRTK